MFFRKHFMNSYGVEHLPKMSHHTMHSPQIPSWNTIFMYWTTKVMIVLLYNTIYCCIGKTWWRMGGDQNNTRFGLMIIVFNSRAKCCYFLWTTTHNWPMDVFVCGVFLVLGMERALMMGQVLLSRDLNKLSLMYKALSSKMQTKLWYLCMNI